MCVVHDVCDMCSVHTCDICVICMYVLCEWHAYVDACDASVCTIYIVLYVWHMHACTHTHVLYIMYSTCMFDILLCAYMYIHV